MVTKKMVLFYLVTLDQVMFGLKMVRINAGYLTGPGGRRGAVESGRRAAVREAEEEIGVTILPQDLRYCGVLEVGVPLSEGGQLYSDDPVLERHVVVYTTLLWSGQPRESDEIKDLGWFPISDLPFERSRPSDVVLPPSDAIWLPRMLKGEVLRVYLRYMLNGELDVALVTRMSAGADPA